MELVVVRDKFTHESKGSAFVWYTNRADADQVSSNLTAVVESGGPAAMWGGAQEVLEPPDGGQIKPALSEKAASAVVTQVVSCMLDAKPVLLHGMMLSCPAA